MKFKFTLLTFLFFTTWSHAQSQFINEDFGTTNGVACVSIPEDTSAMGDIVKVNNDYYGLTSFVEYNLVKLSASGDVVTTFGTNGYVPLNIASGEGGINYKNCALVATPDDKLIMVSTFNGIFNHNFMTKTDLDGNIITSFGNNGYVSTWGTDRIGLLSVEIINNEIVIVGRGNSTDIDNPYAYIIVMKYDLNGNPVTSYGNNGIATFDIENDTMPKSAHYFPELNHVAVLIQINTNEETYNYIIKYDLSADTPDMSFGTDGYIYYQAENEIYTIPDILYSDNNHIYVAGWTGLTPSESSIFIKKMGLNGQPDLTFSNEGTFLYAMDNAFYYTLSSMIKNNGNITLTGNLQNEDVDYEKIFLLRATEEGTIETDFGINGLIVHPGYLSVFVSTSKTLIEYDNQITVATRSNACSDTSEPKPAIVQFITGTLSSEAVVKDNTLSYYPNPVKDMLYINTPYIDKAEVYDVTGKLLVTISNIKVNTIDFCDFQAGLYLVKVYTGDRIQNIKVIKE